MIEIAKRMNINCIVKQYWAIQGGIYNE
jgi:hypothetical protein